MNPATRSVARRLSRGRLRILAFHGVEDLTRFDAVVRRVCRRFTPVSENDVAQALLGNKPLPAHAVWFTFDDGLASTLTAGELLANRGVSATLFVNPGAVEPPSLLWFHVLDAALSAGLIPLEEAPSFTHARLKRLPDSERRTAIALLDQRLNQAGIALESPVGAVTSLHSWVSQGHTIGNHTWDHPILDTCSPEQQAEQVKRTHSWLSERGFAPRFFAYPNGNATETVAKVASELGYVGSLLFDHSLTDLRAGSHALSRLRIDSSAPLNRVDAILSGAHSALFSLSGARVRRSPRRLKQAP